MRILGLDPGSQATGFGIIDWVAGDARYVASGAIRTSGADFPPRLRQIFEGVLALMREYGPAEVAIERVFMHRNADSALKLGQARGAALCAVFSGDPEVYEYAPREVKLALDRSSAEAATATASAAMPGQTRLRRCGAREPIESPAPTPGHPDRRSDRPSSANWRKPVFACWLTAMGRAL